MRIVIPGGSGQVGQILARHLSVQDHEVIVLSRGGDVPSGRSVFWDGKTLGDWTSTIDGADAVINLAGRSVNCRYTAANLALMMSSRVDSTRVVGEAIARSLRPPRVWLQMSTATIYAHRYDAANDETSGIIGGGEPDVPRYWDNSIDVAKRWEQTLQAAGTTKTRRVAMRTAMVMSPDRGSVFDVLLKLVRRGLGGKAGDGRQYVSWIHDVDFLRAVDWLIERDDIEGAINLASPGPMTHSDFMKALREAWGIRFGLPATRGMLELGAWALRTDTELLLKSRRVVPGRLLALGMPFDFPDWQEAARNLVARWRTAGPRTARSVANG